MTKKKMCSDPEFRISIFDLCLFSLFGSKITVIECVLGGMRWNDVSKIFIFTKYRKYVVTSLNIIISTPKKQIIYKLPFLNHCELFAFCQLGKRRVQN